MAAIIKANSTLTSGGLVVMRRSFVTSDDGSMRYSVDYCCLERFANQWTPFFRTRANPPTRLPSEMLQLNLTKTPELYDLTLETVNGLTYFKAAYSAGVSTEVIITEDSDVRNFTITTTRDVGYSVSTPGTINGSTSFVKTGEETVTNSFDYISVTVTAQSKNTNLPRVQGRIEPIAPISYSYRTQLINRSSKTRSSRGEYTYSFSSSGVIENITQRGGRRAINP
jgi:hypothetical protein